MIISEEMIKQLLGNDILGVKEIKEKGNLDISSLWLANYLMKQDYIKTIETRNKPNKYKVVPVLSFTGNVVKEKNILKMELTDNTFLEYDFNTNSFVDTNKIPSKNIRQQRYNPILQVFSDDYYTPFREIEWLYNYMDLINDRTFRSPYVARDLQTCPNGYINYLKENNLYIDNKTMYDYLIKTKCANIPSILVARDNCYYDSFNIEQLIQLNDFWKKCNVKKILKNSVENYELNIEEDLMDLSRLVLRMQDTYFNYIDTNRSIKYNIEILEDILNAEQNKKLAQNLQQLNFLDNMTIGKYIIKVPQTIKDLQNEGKQQHNCVGHYYNESIIANKNLIYFIRLKNNPGTSLITCRYNLRSQNTVEHRLSNNRGTTQEHHELIAQIDNIIRQYLK